MQKRYTNVSQVPTESLEKIAKAKNGTALTSFDHVVVLPGDGPLYPCSYSKFGLISSLVLVPRVACGRCFAGLF